MSLQFIFGNSGSGKSHYLYNHIIEESMKFPEKNYIVLVPEQFTMQTQRELVAKHPRHGIMNIDVLSFARLAFRILEETGQGNRVMLDDEGKNLILRKIAGKLESSLKVLKGNLKKQGYVSEVKSVISELTQYNITPEDMDEMINVAEPSSYLSFKLQDIQLLYTEFEQFLADKYITKEEVLEVLSQVIPKSRILKNATICLDGFTGFTPIQNKVLREMMKCCEKVIVTVAMDGREHPYHMEDALQLFAMSKQTAISLTAIAKEEKIEIEEPIELYEKPVYRFRENKTLAHLEQEIFREQSKAYEEKTGNIAVYCTKNPKEEALFAAQKVRSLIRKRGYHYHEVAIITSDMETYADELVYAFDKYDIPYFMDHKRSILLNPFVEYVRSLLFMAEKNFTGESVIRFLRTGLTEFSSVEIDLLENYIRALGVRGYKKWQEKWIRRGKTTTEEELELLNHLRVRFVEIVDEMVMVLKQKRKTVQDISEALYYFFERERLQEKISAQQQAFESAGELALAKEYEQIYRVVLELFDKFVKLLGEEYISISEYAQLLDAGMEEARIGVIPPGVDEVMIGDIQRTRLKDIKALILMGVNDHLIPGTLLNGGLLTEHDRSRFEEEGISLTPNGKEKIFIQKFYLYLHMTKPTEELAISYSKVSAEGKNIRPAYLIAELQKLFPKMRVFDMDGYGMEAMELSVETGKEMLIKGLHDSAQMENPAWQELYRWYRKQEFWKDKVEMLVNASMYKKSEDSLAKETAEKLFSLRKASISRLEKFASCACAHFLTYGLGLKEREEYEFVALDFGNIFHTALEKYARRVEGEHLSWEQIPEDKQREFIDHCIEESIVDYNNTLLYSSARNNYMIPRMKRMMGRTIWAMTNQLKRGEFQPEGFEVNFGSGKIDRIDTCENGDEVYVKIMDYKTGSKKFDMAAFYHGLQLQLIVYMQEALQLETRKHAGKKAVPAGVFYYHLKDPIVDKEIDQSALEEAILKELRLDGIVHAQDAIIERLDKTFTKNSNVIPVGKTTSGYAKASKLLSTEEFDDVLEYAAYQREHLQKEMTMGNADAAPYQLGQETGCDYCKYRGICKFDEQVEGYEYRELTKYSQDEVLMNIRMENKNRREGGN